MEQKAFLELFSTLQIPAFYSQGVISPPLWTFLHIPSPRSLCWTLSLPHFSPSFWLLLLLWQLAACSCSQREHNPPVAPLLPAFCSKIPVSASHPDCLLECTHPLWCMCKPRSMKEVILLGGQKINALLFCVSGTSFLILKGASKELIVNFPLR